MTARRPDRPEAAAGGVAHAPSQPLLPPPPSSAIVRPELISRLDTAVQQRLTVLVAPPGSGKSVLLAQWARSGRTHRIGWLTLDERDNDARHFAGRLVGMLQGFSRDVGVTALERVDASGLALGPIFLETIAVECLALPPCVLVIDNLHAINNPELAADIGQLVETAPAHVQFVMSTRREPPFSLHRLRLLGEVTELRGDDLALDPDALRAVVGRVANVELDDRQVTQLANLTEGWAAGVQLAALAMRGAKDPQTFLSNFAGGDRSVAEYLTEEVLAAQPREVHDFLLNTSVLDRLTSSLCNALTGADDGARMLDLLDRRGLFIIPLDNRRQWYRYHRLFRDLLRYRLVVERPGLDHVLLARAAGWHLNGGDPAPALAYLIAAEQWDEAGGLLVRQGRQLWERGEAGLAMQWMESIPTDVLSANPDALLTYATLAAAVGRSARVEQLLTDLEASAVVSPGARTYADMLRTLAIQFGATPAHVTAAADRALAALATPEGRLLPDVMGFGSADRAEAAILGSLGRAQFYDGDTASARRSLERSMTGAGLAFPLVAVGILGSVAYLEATEGNLTEADLLATRGLAAAKDTNIETHLTTADALLALGRVAHERWELDRARVLLDEAGLRAQQNQRFTLAALCRLEQAAVELTARRPAHGLRTIQAPAGEPPLPGAVRARLAAMEARLLLCAGAQERAHEIVGSLGDGGSLDVRIAAVEASLAAGDLSEAQALVAIWPTDGSTRSRVERAVWSGVVAERLGDHRGAVQAVADALAEGEPDGHISAFVNDGIARALRDLERAQPTPYLQRICEAFTADPLGVTVSGELVEQLSDRELAVLRYLPGRLSNPDIAADLYISVNTLKTHLKHVYRKLGVTTRRAAVEEAERLGLL